MFSISAFSSSSVGVSGNFAYVVGDESDELKVIDVSDPDNPSIRDSLAIGRVPTSVAISGNYAYVVDIGSDDLKVIELSCGGIPLAIDPLTGMVVETEMDNLGDHTATQTLDMSNNDIINADTVTAGYFSGDGSALTNLTGDDLGNHTATQNVQLNGNWISNDGDSEGVFVDAGGSVGIGENTPSQQLEVAGNTQLTNDDPELIFFEDGGSDTRKSSIQSTLYMGVNVPPYTAADQKMIFNVSDNSNTGMTQVMTLVGNGNVGIGDASPDYNLEVNGTAGKPGGGSWTNSSDRRLKQNINPYYDGLDAILAINPVTFNYNELSGFDTQPEYVGVIAQELKEIAPYMVSEYKKDGKDFLNVDPSALNFMLINALKERHKLIKVQQEELEAMKTKNALLKALNAEMKTTDDELKAEIENIKALLGINHEIVKNK